jgi:hypothetical protein
MRSLGFLVLPLLLTNCAATPSAYDPPVVDMRGVDPQKYAHRLWRADLQLPGE